MKEILRAPLLLPRATPIVFNKGGLQTEFVRLFFYIIANCFVHFGDKFIRTWLPPTPRPSKLPGLGTVSSVLKKVKIFEPVIFIKHVTTT